MERGIYDATTDDQLGCMVDKSSNSSPIASCRSRIGLSIFAFVHLALLLTLMDDLSYSRVGD